MLLIELIGYLGSILVAISLMMRNILKLRIINMTGAFIFIVYSLIIQAYPVFLVNLVIFFINIYFLYEIMTKQEDFSVIWIKDKNSPIFQKFIEYYHDDIKKFFPNFTLDTINEGKILLILRNMVPVGIFVSKPIDEKRIEIVIDYIIPAYRDFKNAYFVYKQEIEKYKAEGYDTFITHTKNGIHKKYLLKIGYEQDSMDPHLFKKKFE